MTFFAAFREGQFLRKQSCSRFFLKNPEAIPGNHPGAHGVAQQWPFSYIVLIGTETRRVGYATRWGETHEMSVFGSKMTIFHCFSPKNHCLAQFGEDLSGDPDGDDS